ncbi:MAG TPA: hypothetical protein VJH67_03890 [Candidatus Paceibacterota bacterium]
MKTTEFPSSQTVIDNCTSQSHIVMALRYVLGDKNKRFTHWAPIQDAENIGVMYLTGKHLPEAASLSGRGYTAIEVAAYLYAQKEHTKYPPCPGAGAVKGWNVHSLQFDGHISALVLYTWV